MMADKPLPWFRLYSELISDRKITMISRLTERSKAEVVGAFTTLMCLASESPNRGALMATELVPYSLEDIANEFYLDEQDTEELLNCFRNLSMLDFVDNAWIILNWNKRQYKSDDSSERVTKFRMKQANQESETLQRRYSNAEVTTPETETEADTDTEADTEKESARDAFTVIQQTIERLTGLPITPNKLEIDAINEMVSIGITEDDLIDAVAWFKKKGKIEIGRASCRERV